MEGRLVRCGGAKLSLVVTWQCAVIGRQRSLAGGMRG